MSEDLKFSSSVIFSSVNERCSVSDDEIFSDYVRRFEIFSDSVRWVCAPPHKFFLLTEDGGDVSALLAAFWWL